MPSSSSAGSSSMLYDSIRTSVQATGQDSRVEVNQRALIDKILARYASAGAVYRELLQNSNDAEASIAEIHFTTVNATATNAGSSSTSTALAASSASSSSNRSNIVQQVMYRNNGMPFRPQDWSRLQKIAEGNPDVSKVGAFGVGAYTMFSICEEPLVISGTSSLCFVWKGDALWCKTAPLPPGTPTTEWTSFVLPSRDPYPVPNLLEFGEFLCSSLTFTQYLKHVRVFVNDQERLSITKTMIQEPRIVVTPKSSSWWSSQGAAVTTTPQGLFTLAKHPQHPTEQSIYESMHRMTVVMDGTVAFTDARYVSATAVARIGSDMARRMERVTKKAPPQTVSIQLFLNATKKSSSPTKTLTPAERITHSFAPRPGAGRIFIGFRTSQTTGLAAHVAAPFVPTVEREAMDLQDAALRVFNTELLELAGILLRLTLEHSLYTYIDVAWQKNAAARLQLEAKLRDEEKQARLEKSKRRSGDGSGNSSSGTTANGTTNGNAKAETAEEEDDDASLSVAGGLMGFARFMARGVRKKIVAVVNTVEELITDDGPDLLHPSDPRPLSSEEEDAIVLMQSFCPMQSTPDPWVGTALAQGFARCLPTQTPPVLTRSGVVRGDVARLPQHGMERFIEEHVVRTVVYQNCPEYHDVIAGCRKLQMVDLLQTIGKQPMEEEDMITLIRWITKFKRIDTQSVMMHGLAVKEAIRFYPVTAPPPTNGGEREIQSLRNLLFYVEKDSVLANAKLPMPETVLPARLQEEIGSSTLSDSALQSWFNPLMVEIWVEFISHHAAMTEAKPEDERLRIEILSTLNKVYTRRAMQERDVFGSFCHSLLSDKKCLPFDADEPTPHAAERPPDLYLYSAELKAFEGIGSFYKVAASLKHAGITEDFLLALGVRKSVSIDFLFANLESLKWSADPKPLIEYLRSATLTREDMRKLCMTQYLPAAQDNSRLFAPSELYLPNAYLVVFPFVRLLQWPSEPEVSEKSDNGKFLVKIGMKHMPPLDHVLEYLSTIGVNIDDVTRVKCFDFLCERLGPQGLYYNDYAKLGVNRRKAYRFLPCLVKHPFDLDHAVVSEMHSPVTCFSEAACSVMGFPVLDPAKLGKNVKLYGSLFYCVPEPEASFLINQLKHLVTKAKILQQQQHQPKTTNVATDKTAYIIETFKAIFKYLSHRTSELDEWSMRGLQNEHFIPCLVDGKLEWLRSDQVFFRRAATTSSSTSPNPGEEPAATTDTMTEELFHVIEFSPFLAAAGVKQEATTKDLFLLLLTKPEKVLQTLGSEKKYRSLLRRIAANPPFQQVTTQIRSAPFLLAYKVKTSDKPDTEDVTDYHLAKAEDIYVIDNSFFGRMFSVNQAPHESDLEDFYVKLGSRYISKSVDRRFEVVGKPDSNTPTTRALKERLMERTPLLISPNITSRPLVKQAASVLSEKNLTFYEAANLMAVYSLDGKTRRNQTTCCSRSMKGNANAVFVVKNFDWFDVGYAIGDLILTRCQLEDAFFISSLLEAPLAQLRARGFPVDRIIPPEPKVIPVAKPAAPVVPIAPPPPPPAAATAASPYAPTMAEIPPLPTPAAAAAAKAPPVPPAEPAAQNRVGPTEDSKPTTTQKDQVKEEQKVPPPNEPNKGASTSGLEEVIMEMFPDANKEFVRSALGQNPSLDDMKWLADQMAMGDYPKEPGADDDQKSSSGDKKASGLRGRLSRALGGTRRGSKSTPPIPPAPVGGHNFPSAPSSGSSSINGPSTNQMHENAHPVSPADDVQSQSGLERMLEQVVNTSTQVQPRGIESNPTKLTSSIPEGLDRGETCEIVPGHSLKPYLGSRGDGKTVNGIRIFSRKHMDSSETFVREKEDAVEKFGLVLERLADVYGVPLSAIAIYHDPVAQSIAFNSNRSLHFNLRFFYALHYLTAKHDSAQCYSYWYMTFAHELSHHLVSAHNKEHGFYTESYASQYLPKLVALLRSLE